MWQTDDRPRYSISNNRPHLRIRIVLRCGLIITKMWADAQRDGRPADYRWRPLFNATKFGWRPLLECRAVMLPRRETRWNLQGCPKLLDRSQLLVGHSSPYCGDICTTYCCLVSFFPIVDRCLSCEDIARETCAMVRRWTENDFFTWQNSIRRQEIPKVYKCFDTFCLVAPQP